MRPSTLRAALPACVVLLCLAGQPAQSLGVAEGRGRLHYRPYYPRVRDYRVSDRFLQVYVVDSTTPVMALDPRRTGAVLDLAYDDQQRELVVLARRGGRTLVRRLRAGRGEEWVLPGHLAPESALYRVNESLRILAEDVSTGTLTRFSAWRFRSDADMYEVTLRSGQREPALRFAGRGFASYLAYDALVGGDEVARRRAVLKQVRYAGALQSPGTSRQASTLLLGDSEPSPVVRTSSVGRRAIEDTPVCVRELGLRAPADLSRSGRVVAMGSYFGRLEVWVRDGRGTYRDLQLPHISPPAAALAAHTEPGWQVMAASASEGSVVAELRPSDVVDPGPVVFWSAVSDRGADPQLARGMLARRLERWQPRGWSDAGELPGAAEARRTPVRASRDPYGHEEGVRDTACLPAIQAAAFSPDGKLVAAGDQESGVRVWDWRTRQEVARLDGHGGPVAAVAFSPDGRRLVTASGDYSAQVWDLKTRRRLALLVHPSWVNSAVFSPDGRHVLTSDVVPRLWKADTGEEVREFAGPHAGALFSALSRDGRLILAGYGDGKTRLWEAAGRQVGVIAGERWVTAGAMSLDGGTVILGSLGAVRVCDRRSGTATQVLGGHAGDVHSVSVAPNGRLLVTAGSDGSVRLWDLRSGRETRRWEYRVVEGGITYSWGEATSARFSPDGRHVAGALQDGTVRVWETATGREVSKLPETPYRVLFQAAGV